MYQTKTWLSRSKQKSHASRHTIRHHHAVKIISKKIAHRTGDRATAPGKKPAMSGPPLRRPGQEARDRDRAPRVRRPGQEAQDRDRAPRGAGPRRRRSDEGADDALGAPPSPCSEAGPRPRPRTLRGTEKAHFAADHRSGGPGKKPDTATVHLARDRTKAPTTHSGHQARARRPARDRDRAPRAGPRRRRSDREGEEATKAPTAQKRSAGSGAVHRGSSTPRGTEPTRAGPHLARDREGDEATKVPPTQKRSKPTTQKRSNVE
jgi:hypothetical protein